MLLSGVLLTLAILSISAVSRSFFTSSQAAECQATLAGELCEALASSAVAELEAQVRGALANPDGEIAKRMSRPIVGSEDPTIDLTGFMELKETTALAGQDLYAGCEIDDWTAKVTVQKPLDRLPYERIGVVTFKARAKGSGGGRAVARTLEESRAFKIGIVGPPRPFDRYGIFLGEMGAVSALDSVNPARLALIAQVGRMRAKLDAAVAAASGDLKERLLDLQDDFPTVASATASVKEMSGKAGSMFYGLIPNNSELDLEKLELGRSVGESVTKGEELLGALPAQTAPDFLDKAREAAKAISDGLWSIWAFQSAFIVSAPGDSDYQALRPYLNKLDEGWFARRAHYRLIEEANAPHVNVQLQELLKSGPLAGIVHVQSRTQKLELTGHFPGRLMFVVGAGGVSMTDVNKTAPITDRLTVAGFQGAVAVHGECHAHVIAGARTPLLLERGAKIVGGLTCREVAAGTRLEGTVERREIYYSNEAGPGGEEDTPTVSFTLILSPQILYRRVFRS